MGEAAAEEAPHEVVPGKGVAKLAFLIRMLQI
jgi:hypothetical protein